MNEIKPVSYSDFRKRVLQDPVMKKMYDDLEEEFKFADAIIKKRLEKKLTQKQLAEKLGTKQSAIARLESGEYNPSFKLLKKVAKALDSKVIITFKDI